MYDTIWSALPNPNFRRNTGLFVTIEKKTTHPPKKCDFPWENSDQHAKKPLDLVSDGPYFWQNSIDPHTYSCERDPWRSNDNKAAQIFQLFELPLGFEGCSDL